MYTYIFSDFTDNYGDVKIINHRSSKEYHVNVRVDDKSILSTSKGRLSSLLADLVDLAAAIFVSDWLLPRKLEESCDICVELPVRNPRFLNQNWVTEELSSLLRWYTDDRWHFEFRPRRYGMRLAERQPALALFNEFIEVALWSGGLDSLAGLYRRAANGTAPLYTLVGTGSNTMVQGKQRAVADSLRERLIPVKLIQVPILLEYPNERPPGNDLFRARGFVFKLLGAICALLEDQHTLHIYENGFGAINLPFTKAEIGLAHTRSTHPISLIDTGKFVSKLVDVSFRYKNPYLFTTKAQMCMSLASCPDLASDTITCDSRYRQTDQPLQCGYCSSCLLRRMALLIALGKDQTEYVVTHGIVNQPLLQRGHYEAMNYQASELREVFNSTNPWQSLLERYPSLRQLVGRIASDQGAAIDSIQEGLLQLYREHVKEWNDTREKLRTV